MQTSEIKLLNFGKETQLCLFFYFFGNLTKRVCGVFFFSFMYNLAFLLKVNFSISFKK